MRTKLKKSLTRRLLTEISVRNPVKFLKALDLDDIVDRAITTVYLYTRMKKKGPQKAILLTEVISAIGHGIRNANKLKQDSSLAAKAGAFVLYSFEDCGWLTVNLTAGTNGHQVYCIKVIDEAAITSLWSQVKSDKTEKLPSTVPYADWTSAYHETGTSLVKTTDYNVLQSLTPETHPMIFELVNRAQHVGWRINEDIYHLYEWALQNKTEAFSDIWELQDQEAKTSKLREAISVGEIAKRFLNDTFYHLYTLDFRGRKYVSTAYLHEQGADLARGLLLRADAKRIGQQGFYWLCISIANNWAGEAGRDDKRKTDKIPLNDRVNWVLDNEATILSYANDPKNNQGWMSADSPWQFIAACLELKKFRNWQVITSFMTSADTYDEYGYESHLEAFIDGSNNGSQHLTALTRDEVTAPHVNLVPSEYPGDLYAYVADHVWKRLQLEVAKLTPEAVEEAEQLIDTLIDLKRKITEAAPHTEERDLLVKEIMEYKKGKEAKIKEASPVFWNRIKEASHKRKICKRGTMTLAYGATAYGTGQQVIDDARKHGIPLLLFMEHSWGAYIGRLIHEDCRVSLKRPTQVLAKFEEAGKLAEQNKVFLKWTAPFTNFPVVQHYTEGVVRDIHVQYGPPDGIRLPSGYYPNNYALAISFLEDTVPSRFKQSQGAAPNAIHSLDAAHLTLVVCSADFPVTTIHDSFGALLADMEELFILTRETFVKLYSDNPLCKTLEAVGTDLKGIDMGNLDISEILNSEYCFA